MGVAMDGRLAQASRVAPQRKDGEEGFPAVLSLRSFCHDEASVGGVCVGGVCTWGGELWAAPQSANAAVAAIPIASTAITAAISLTITPSFPRRLCLHARPFVKRRGSPLGGRPTKRSALRY